MKILTGKIVLTKMAKTATVEVVRFVAHPIYKKRLKRTKKYQVHDEFGHKINEVVDFAPSKPYSKTVKWSILPKKEENQAKKPKEKKSAPKKAPRKPGKSKK